MNTAAVAILPSQESADDTFEETEKGVIKVSASVGCVLANGDVTQVGDLLHKADEAMYLTKKEKRQKVSCQA